MSFPYITYHFKNKVKEYIWMCVYIYGLLRLLYKE